ncbi:MAG: methyltransferase domain-containing protein [Akkermansiaceae bacterium]|jgi:ribosomal protein L11 methyltransferase|nr:methyltransferase domain-containing protein [Akkermansiaceae bacterium]
MFVWSKVSPVSKQSILEEQFLGLSQTNAVITELPGKKSFRIEVYCNDKNDAQKLLNEFGGQLSKLITKDWAKLNASSERPPIKIRNRLIITDSNNKSEIKKISKNFESRDVISIPAALAFGTGDHETTSTCLRLLVDLAKEHKKNNKEWSLCDIGTGTGILAIAAKILGSTIVECFDFDSTAIDIAKRNMLRNKTTDIFIYEADLFEWEPKKKKCWDIITANIFANVLNANLSKIFSALAPRGSLILSGILREHENSVIATAQQTSLTDPIIYRKGKWVSMHYRKD